MPDDSEKPADEDMQLVEPTDDNSPDDDEDGTNAEKETLEARMKRNEARLALLAGEAEAGDDGAEDETEEEDEEPEPDIFDEIANGDKRGKLLRGREVFEVYKPKADGMALLHEIQDIVEDYGKQGLTLTLRQLYYQCVTKNLIRNEEKQYKRVGDIVSRARRGGMLPWNAIEDRVRQPEMPSEFNNLRDLIDAAFRSYRLPRLKGQETYVELWVEKDALAGVLAPLARAYHVVLMVNRGYSSTSAMYAAGTRIRDSCKRLGAKRALVLYLGDHDPSGEDMVRDVSERLREYANSGYLLYQTADAKIKAHLRGASTPITVRKIALTKEQVNTYNPPPNPAKLSDSRAAKYVEIHGAQSWEVDALPPVTLRQIIEDELGSTIDDDLVREIVRTEESDKRRLLKAMEGM